MKKILIILSFLLPMTVVQYNKAITPLKATTGIVKIAGGLVAGGIAGVSGYIAYKLVTEKPTSGRPGLDKLIASAFGLTALTTGIVSAVALTSAAINFNIIR